MKRLAPFLGLVALVAAAYAIGALEPLERQWMNWRFGLVERPAEGGIVVVGIDPKSLRVLDVWPWARGYHATVLETLIDAGASRVGFDIDFSSRSDPEEDAEFAGALRTAGPRVVLASLRQRDDDSRLATTRPIESFRDGPSLATINIRPDRDGLVRRYRTAGKLDGEPIPSFATALGGIANANYEEFYVDFSIDPKSIPRLSYVDVLTRQFDPHVVRGKVVIIGATAVEVGDNVAVPLHASLAGPLLQALAFESMVQRRALQRSGGWFTVGFTLFLGLMTIPVFEALSWRRGLLLAVALASIVFCLTLAAQALAPVIIDVSPWILVVLGNFGIVTVRNIDQQRVRLLVQSLTLRRTETLMQHVVDNSFDAIVTVDRAGLIETTNPAADSMFGLKPSETVGRHISQLVSRRDDPGAVVTRPGPWLEVGALRELTGHRSDRTGFPIEMAVRAIDGDDRGRRVYFIRDITEIKAHQQALEHQATHDALTRLPNRLLLRTRMEQALDEAWTDRSPVALMILDLDRFKEINDTLGHHVGDLLLQQIGERLSKPLRDGDTVARFGGDEFAVLLPGARLDEARQLGKQLIDALTEPLRFQDLLLQIDASVGIAMFPEHGTGPIELIQRADVAMYLAKRAGDSMAVYSPTEDYTSVRNLTLTGELREAISRNELVLCYQPKISCRGDSLVGVEALVRWNHPRHGLLPPNEFIPLAEHSGLIKPLSQWVISAAIRQCAEWYRQGILAEVAINLSTRNLQEEDLPSRLAELLEDLALPPSQITLEITESVIMDDPERAMKVVTEFNDLGVGISIDDFGTGYSSLAYLKRLPAKEIKIDRAFVSEIDTDKDDAVIVRSTIEMAHNLGLSVVAEGVETEQIWQQIKSLGCNSGQGYFFSAPLRAADLLRWIEDGSWSVAREPGQSRSDRVAADRA